MTPTGRALRAAVPFALVPAVVLGVILGLALGLVAGVVAFVVVAGALGAWVRFGGDRRVQAAVRGRPADPARDARLCNLLEGLATGAGVRHPRLLVVDSPGLNVMAAGTTPGRAVLAVTSGLLEELTRIELEGVLAEALWLIRHNETLPATVLAATFGIGRSAVLTADRDTTADQGAVSLTRYPPALASALEKIERKGAVVAGQSSSTAQLWLADPRPSPPPTTGRIPLHDRIEALREL